MARKKKPLPILENIQITDCAAEGKSLARVNDMVVFVPFCVPGDIVDLQVRKKRHSYMEAEVIRFVEKSAVREEPFCEHFGVCGGCKWQNLPYDKQLEMKQRQVYEQLTRIGKVELPEFMPILGSRKIREYRNKLEFGCSNKRWMTREEIASGEPAGEMRAIGFHITGAFDKILPIHNCHLMDGLQNEIRNFIYQYAIDNDLTFFDLRQQTGLLRDVMVRNSNTGEWMVLVQFHYDEEGDRERSLQLMEALADRFPQITSLLYVDNQKCNDTFGDLKLTLYKGNDHIFEIMEGLRFKVGPKSFYQTNTDQAYHLYSVARQFAGLTGEEVVYDLYTGTGTIANFVARSAKKVVGIEYVPEAIEDAKVNSDINGIGNTLFFAGDMKDILTDEFIAGHGRPDVIITDPPRAGMHPDVVETILRAKPRRIVYVSCNPATQARDLQLLDRLYKVVAVQPVDMFPHTPHVENVVALELK
ncbi:23S rRNA (uracil(1939)-C(5))-methyltransferase RlmD [Prevotella pectinovora]|jgi:23S rRNA (uracil1939-C5)-methyltransferase|uniref:RNA methyltransferase n=1 Tax=Prevotella pectinovora TaxID=1602169 RepID=A0A0D0HG72_9BACT|nr:23S rRNA (uracil(1939)-C(5))-methyltransferase RlmD [Prevotella pectinovora]KIP58628.1 RNA methyltransferase [Prevotella pectinovora]KIP64990.1 RNA methyltransferase [Prevotella pectinovora]MCI6047713.1 23S rRNA (uracil(1939)-C(5))-methyltransferase RlmD [Prevotella pectinovora]